MITAKEAKELTYEGVKNDEQFDLCLAEIEEEIKSATSKGNCYASYKWVHNPEHLFKVAIMEYLEDNGFAVFQGEDEISIWWN